MKSSDIIKKRYLSFDVNDSVSHLVGSMLKNKLPIVIFDKKKFVGIPDKRLLLNSRIDLSKLKVSKILKKVPVLSGKEDLKESARLLYSSNSDYLPLLNKNNVLGVVSAFDIIKNLDVNLKNSRVQDIIALRPVVLREKDPLSVALKFMREKKINVIPVVDKKGDVVRVVSITDFLNHFLIGYQSRSERKNASFFKSKSFRSEKVDFTKYFLLNTSSLALTLSKDVFLKDVIDVILKSSVSSVVIVDKKKAVGVVGLRDLLKCLV